MKKTFAMILALVMLFALCACGETAAPAPTEAPAAAAPAPAAEPEPAPEAPAAPVMTEKMGVTIPALSLNINGQIVTDADLAEYAVYEISATSVNSSGTESTVTYVGFSLPDVFAAAGITEAKTLKVIATDGYELELDGALAFEPTTLIAITRDGAQFKDGPWFAPCSSGTTGDYLKGMAAISVDGADVTVAAPEASEGAAEPTGELPEISDKTDKVTFEPYSFKVNGEEVTNEKLDGLHIYKISVTTINSKGNASDATYTGYKLADVLAACGIEGAAKVCAVANDGYVSELSPELIESDWTLVAIEKDKELGEGGTIWLAPCSETSSGSYAKLVVEITAE